MATEKCNSVRFLPAGARFRPCSSGKQRLIGSEGNPYPLINKLGEDLLVEILIRSFPNPKCAYCCKLVCKQWNSLISGSYFNSCFVSHHQRRNEGEGEPPLMFSYSRDHVFGFLPVPEEVRYRRYYRFLVMDSFMDLILCGFEEVMGPDGPVFSGELARSFFVCNPFTEQWVALPLAPEKSTQSSKWFPRLLCEPRSCCNLDLGEGKAFAYSEYRFRVVCLYQHMSSIKLDVFCSESEKWEKEALVCDDLQLLLTRNVISCNGKLFWCSSCSDPGWLVLAVYNPFCPDVPPTRVRIRRCLSELEWNVSVSRGAFYVVVLEGENFPFGLYVWRLEGDLKTWTMQYESSTASSRGNYGVNNAWRVLDLHPGNPEIVFLRCCSHDDVIILTFDLRSQELRFFDEPQGSWSIFQPKIFYWPTPIPRYEKLRGLYDGSHNCWVQRSSKATTTPSPVSLVSTHS